MTKALATAIAFGSLLAPHCGVAQGYSGAPSVPAEIQEKQVEALQDQIESQPDTMEAIRSLQSDPAFQDILNDPEITRALESGDMAALLANPKIGALVNHPIVQDVSKKLGQ